MAGMGVATMVMAIASTVAQTVNSYQNMQAQAEANKANAQVAETNARNKRLEADVAKDRLLREGRQHISKQYVGNLVSGASGADTTANRALEQSAINLNKDLKYLDFNYGNQAVDFLNQSAMYRYQSDVARANAGNALIGGAIGVGNSIMQYGAKNMKANNMDNMKADNFAGNFAYEKSVPIYNRHSKLFYRNY